jgi:integrase
MKKQLSAQAVERTKPPKTGRLEIDDLVVPGLVLRVTDKGVKSWSLLYRVAGEGGLTTAGLPKRGKLRRITLGRYPVLDLKGARDAARRALALADNGDDPAVAKASELIERREQRALTVAKVVEEYIEKRVKPRIRREREMAAHLDRRLVRPWGDRPISEITKRDAVELLDSIAFGEGLPGAAANTLKNGRAVWNWARKRDLVEFNPFEGADNPHQPEAQERVLDAFEIAAVWKAAERTGYPFGAFVQLLLLTGQRRTNIAAMEWSWLDLEAGTITIPAHSFKGKRTHLAPLSSRAGELLAGLHRFRGGDYVLTTRHGRRPISGFSKMKTRLDSEVLRVLRENDPKAQPLAPWKLHDLRRTVATGLQELGYDPTLIDRVLGHAYGGLRAVYQKHDYAQKKTEALEAWGDYLRRVVGEAGENVRAIG